MVPIAGGRSLKGVDLCCGEGHDLCGWPFSKRARVSRGFLVPHRLAATKLHTGPPLDRGLAQAPVEAQGAPALVRRAGLLEGRQVGDDRVPGAGRAPTLRWECPKCGLLVLAPRAERCPRLFGGSRYGWRSFAGNAAQAVEFSTV